MAILIVVIIFGGIAGCGYWNLEIQRWLHESAENRLWRLKMKRDTPELYRLRFHLTAKQRWHIFKSSLSMWRMNRQIGREYY